MPTHFKGPQLNEPTASAPEAPSPTSGTPSPSRTEAMALPVMPGVQRFVLSGAAIALGVLGLYVGQSLLIPLALAALLAFVLDPAVSWLRRRSVPRGLAVGLVITVTLSALLGAGVLTALQVGDLGRELPTHRKNIQQKLRDLRPALMPSGTTKELARLMGMVEGELAAATSELNLGGKPQPKPTQVAVEARNSGTQVIELISTVGVQLATAALVLILVVFMLLQRSELRDRLLRLMGGDPHLMADALSESAQRVSRYLAAQVLVNLGYGLPMALGLWWIGVPGAWLWGGLAAVLRFVPYLGPAIGAVFPVVAAFAVDPGWSMVLWTLGLIALLELISNNVIEPLAYGGSTGVSPVAVLLSAAFWASLWGPIGLVLATPLTVCLVVIGRHLAPLRFLDVLFSSTPVFDGPTQLYHRLISGHLDEAEDMAHNEVKQHSLPGFYGDTALPMLALAARQPTQGATAAHRHHLLSGTAHIIAELKADAPRPPPTAQAPPTALCVGLRNELDALSADMLAHALTHAGHAARAEAITHLTHSDQHTTDFSSVRTLYLCTLSSAPQTQTRLQVRRLRRQWPNATLHLVAWSAPEALATSGSQEAMGVNAVSLNLPDVLKNAARDASRHDDEHPGNSTQNADPLPTPEPAAETELLRAMQRIASTFGVPRASLTLRTANGLVRCALVGDTERPGWHTESAPAPTSPVGLVLAGEGGLRLSNVHLEPAHLASAHPMYQGLGFFVGLPVANDQGEPLSALALHAPVGHSLSAADGELLARLIHELRPAILSLATAHAGDESESTRASGSWPSLGDASGTALAT
jgi:predicted PurR-regulated permease PerM